MRLLSVYALQRLTSAAPFKVQGRRQTLENAAFSTNDTQWRLVAGVWSLLLGVLTVGVVEPGLRQHAATASLSFVGLVIFISLSSRF